ncbi:MAG: ORF6N domain-containing protein, partial [Bacteroidales bacterium]|nr:ORF6N domain-containing protein [Bacteroidales bacterium]
MSNIVKFSEVENKIIDIRDKKVIIDSDVAELYGVEAKRVNEAVKNNPDKFPDGYIFELYNAEKQQLVENLDRFESLKHSTVLPKAFTKKGLYMLATILKSPQATETTIAIVEAFERIQELQSTMVELSESKQESVQKSLMQKSGDIISELLGSDMQTTDS